MESSKYRVLTDFLMEYHDNHRIAGLHPAPLIFFESNTRKKMISIFCMWNMPYFWLSPTTSYWFQLISVCWLHLKYWNFHEILQLCSKGAGSGRWGCLGVKNAVTIKHINVFLLTLINRKLSIWVHFTNGTHQDYIFAGCTCNVACVAPCILKRPAPLITNNMARPLTVNEILACNAPILIKQGQSQTAKVLYYDCSVWLIETLNSLIEHLVWVGIGIHKYFDLIDMKNKFSTTWQI